MSLLPTALISIDGNEGNAVEFNNRFQMISEITLNITQM